jgi:hypothetical protein
MSNDDNEKRDRSPAQDEAAPDAPAVVEAHAPDAPDGAKKKKVTRRQALRRIATGLAASTSLLAVGAGNGACNKYCDMGSPYSNSYTNHYTNSYTNSYTNNYTNYYVTYTNYYVTYTNYYVTYTNYYY